MKEYIISTDRHALNYIEGEVEWGTVSCPKWLEVSISSKRDGDIVKEVYTFTNTGDTTVFTSLGDISIATPINDDYKDALTCMTSRAHCRIWCGEEVSYIRATRMGGEAPHFGLVLTEGSLGSYSVVRDKSKLSNDRGDFFVHPSPKVLEPGESFNIAWTIFPHDGEADFYKRAAEHSTRFIDITAERWLLFKGETISLDILPRFDFKDVEITCKGKPVEFTRDENVLKIRKAADQLGEYRYDIKVDGVKTFCELLVQPELDRLSETRCGFIVDNQQYLCEGSALDGAFLEYDNEENHMRYADIGDHNASRERIGMGLLLARYLRTHENKKFDESLKRYTKFIYRELFDENTGEVFNDYRRNNSRPRLYNYPWFSLYFTELYELYGDVKYIRDAAKASLAYYERGGMHFYAFETPYFKLIKCLERENETELIEKLLEQFKIHAEFILDRGTNYPAHEVRYEQSIVAPAAELLLQVYRLTGEEKYLVGAKHQLEVLDLFSGHEPSYHFNEVAIRHWDGYWFGKYKLFGDTFPHYWSALSGNDFMRYYHAVGDEASKTRAENSLRAVLSMIFPDGRASCAYVFPLTVNGEKAALFDPYANDQDWGLYFMLRANDPEL